MTALTIEPTSERIQPSLVGAADRRERSAKASLPPARAHCGKRIEEPVLDAVYG